MNEPPREPILNVPAPLVVFTLALVGIHAALSYAGEEQAWRAVLHGAFIPARLLPDAVTWESWTMWLTYPFLHGNWPHVIFNSIWMVVFGTPVLARTGLLRFALLALAGAIGAAALHASIHWGDVRPVIGASGIVSAMTGAAARFAFARRSFDRDRMAVAPRLSLAQVFTSVPTLGFVAVWMVANILFGAGLIDGGQAGSVAWEAHIGGFLVGLLAFPAFDRQPNPSEPSGDSVL